MYGPSVAFVSPTASLLFVRNHLLDAVSISSDWLGWGDKKHFIRLLSWLGQSSIVCFSNKYEEAILHGNLLCCEQSALARAETFRRIEFHVYKRQ